MTMKTKALLIFLVLDAADCDLHSQIRLGASVFATGGGMMSDGTYAAAGTVGQGVIGRATGTYVAAAGFWGDGGTILDVEGLASAQMPVRYGLMQNYPNPFNPRTTIKYDLPKSSMVKLSVYDILGREVSVLVNDMKNAGSYEVKYDASGLSSGFYFYRIQAGDFVQSKRLVVLK